MSETTEVDLTGLRCPLPVLKLQKLFRTLRSGDQVRVCMDDPLADIDIPHFCQEAGHRLLRRTQSGRTRCFVISRR